MTGVCDKCGYKGYVEIHHRDENPKNGSPRNLAFLCRNCHYEAHHGKKLAKPDWAEVRRQYFACFPRA